MKMQLTKTKSTRNGPKIIEEVKIATQPLQHTQKPPFLVTFI